MSAMYVVFVCMYVVRAPDIAADEWSGDVVVGAGIIAYVGYCAGATSDRTASDHYVLHSHWLPRVRLDHIICYSIILHNLNQTTGPCR
jgi:hypothetical protein